MKKKKILRLLFVIFIILLNIVIFMKVDYEDLSSGKVNFVVRVASNKDDTYQIYYSPAGGSFVDNDSQAIVYDGFDKRSNKSDVIGETQTLVFEYPLGYDNLRFDLGSLAGVTQIYDMYFELPKDARYDIPLDQLVDEKNALQITSRTSSEVDSDISYQKKMVVMETEEGDPNLLVQFHKDVLVEQIREANKNKSLIMDIVICVIIDLLAVYILLHFFSLIDIPVEIYQNRKIVVTLAKNDFKTKYAGSYLGILWAFIQPVVTILVYWFVFAVGFRAGRTAGYPFVLFIVTGIVPWFFFADALNGGTSALTDYNYLVKKVVFNIDILPFVKVLSAFFVNCFFVALALVLCTCMGYPPRLNTIQIIYYIACNFMFVTGLAYLCSAIVVFFKDLGQFINIFVLQVGIWITPIMWDAEGMLSPTVNTIFKINPMYYIVSGFRSAILGNDWFWQGDRLLWTIYFWTISILIFGLGAKIFRRLKIHFADVL